MTTCSAVKDRNDPGVMCCVGCRLFWEISDPEPPPCPAARSNDEPSPTGRSRPALPRNYKKSMFTREP
jgi:hypothetical protein